MPAVALWLALAVTDALFAGCAGAERQPPGVQRDRHLGGRLREALLPLADFLNTCLCWRALPSNNILVAARPLGCLIDFDCEAASMSGRWLHCIVLHSACSPPAGDAACPPHHRFCDAKVSLMDADGNTKDDLKLPSGTDEAEKLAVTIQAEFDAGKELTVVVLKVLTLGFRVDWAVVAELPCVGHPLVCTSAVIMCWCQLTPSAWMLTLESSTVQAMGEHYRLDTTPMCHELSALCGPVHALSVC